MKGAIFKILNSHEFTDPKVPHSMYSLSIRLARQLLRLDIHQSHFLFGWTRAKHDSRSKEITAHFYYRLRNESCKLLMVTHWPLLEEVGTVGMVAEITARNQGILR